MSDPTENPRAFLRTLFDRAVALAAPENTLSAHMPSPPKDGRTVVIAAGKAAASMARAFEDQWPSDAPLSGVALTRYDHGVPCKRIEVIEAAHPVPDNRGHDAAKSILETCQSLTKNDLLACLISGGGSSLLALPASGISLDEKKEMNRQLLECGAPIGEMNILRKHVSAIKGGQLAAAAHPARIVTLAISDVPGDHLGTIASGPTVPDDSTRHDALSIVKKYKLSLAASILNHLASDRSETPTEDHRAFQRAQATIITKPKDMIDGIVGGLNGTDLEIHNLGADIEGEARQVAEAHAARVKSIIKASPQKPHLIVSGGETTVTVDVTTNTKPGRGGRNCEYLLALTCALEGTAGVTAIAADSDGIDGSEDNAGAMMDSQTLARAEASGLNATDMLARHDSYSFFDQLGDLVITGPTRTNVNDFRAILIAPR